MQSTDREILLEISGRLMRIERRQDSADNRLSAIESRLDKIEQRQEILATEITELKIVQAEMRGTLSTGLWGGAVGFGILAAVITFASIYVPLLLRKSGSESKPEKSPDVITVEGMKELGNYFRDYASSVKTPQSP